MNLNYLLGLNDGIVKDRSMVRCWIKDPFGKSGIFSGTPGILLEGKNPTEPRLFAGGPVEVVPGRHETPKSVSNDVVVLPFATSHNTCPRRYMSLSDNRLGLTIAGSTEVDALKKVSVIQTPHIDPSKLLSAVDFINNKNPLVFVVNKGDGLSKAIKGLITQAKNNFKFVGATYWKANKVGKPLPDEQIVLIVTMYKPSWCIPYFGEDDGAFVSVSIVYPKMTEKDKGRLKTSLEFSFFMTNNVSAVSGIDGTDYSINSKSTKSLLSWVNELNTMFNTVGNTGSSFDVKKKKGKNEEMDFSFTA